MAHDIRKQLGEVVVLTQFEKYVANRLMNAKAAEMAKVRGGRQPK